MDLAQLGMDRYYSREEFRRWCEAQTKGRYERVDGWIVAMAPERGAHLRVKGAIYRALDRAVIAAGVPCQALPDGATVETGDSDYEPDGLVNCGEPMADDAVAAPNPVIIVEVLSRGTTATDTGGKLADYFRVPSVAHYLIVHPTRRTAVPDRASNPPNGHPSQEGRRRHRDSACRQRTDRDGPAWDCYYCGRDL